MPIGRVPSEYVVSRKKDTKLLKLLSIYFPNIDSIDFQNSFPRRETTNETLIKDSATS